MAPKCPGEVRHFDRQAAEVGAPFHRARLAHFAGGLAILWDRLAVQLLAQSRGPLRKDLGEGYEVESLEAAEKGFVAGDAARQTQAPSAIPP
jgi:hypothetical protein